MRATIALGVLAVTLSAGAEENPRLGVFDFQANGASQQLAAATSGVVANTLQRLELFRVTTSDAIRELVALERQKQIMGCPNNSCVSTLAASLGVDYLVTGKVSHLAGSKDMPSTYTLELTLLHVQQGSRESSAIETALSEAELMAKVEKATHKLVAKILNARSGSLLVNVSETGASVKLDDTLVGTTPLAGRLEVPGGPHLLAVEKKGFVTVQKEVRVQSNRFTEEQVTLIPSPDFIRDYEAGATRMRIGAYLSTGVAVAGLAAAGVMQYQATLLYGGPDVEGTFAYHRAKLLAGIETEGEVDHRQAASSLKAQIESAQRFSYIGAGAGALGAALGAFFWIAGDDPGRYSRFKKTPAPAVALTPTPGGAYATLALDF